MNALVRGSWLLSRATAGSRRSLCAVRGMEEFFNQYAIDSDKSGDNVPLAGEFLRRTYCVVCPCPPSLLKALWKISADLFVCVVGSLGHPRIVEGCSLF
jgi:hypothetical protein